MTGTATQNSIFQGFTKEDFDVFGLEGLPARMAGIQNRIQPKFRAIGELMIHDMTEMTGQEMHLHVAKHLRRTVNPPKDTWLAFAHNKRGYKAHPHFQIGLFDDHAFLWLALIYELPNKSAIASSYLARLDELMDTVPPDYMLSLDHTKSDALRTGDLTKQEWKESLVRFRDVQKAELLIGRRIDAGDPLLQDGENFLAYAIDTFNTLMPWYKLAMA
ncbi:YktB family protein [Paenibacillus sp. GCM10023252]|uniref:YktB family protein n=1 Tax=Paenibacillus sp. GCM10023252 TaxID=3252649 RepID=UPI0036238F69